MADYQTYRDEVSKERSYFRCQEQGKLALPADDPPITSLEVDDSDVATGPIKKTVSTHPEPTDHY